MKFRSFFDQDKKDQNSEKDFRKLQPGTRKWIYYWRDHPEKQKEMIQFMKSQVKEKPILKLRKEKKWT